MILGSGTPSHEFHEIGKTRVFVQFYPVSWAIAHSVGVRGGFKWSGTPSHEFHENRKKLVISGISGRFRRL